MIGTTSRRRLNKFMKKSRVKISFIATVLNEVGSIASFLDSVEKQSRKPDEIIVVDGGSTDGTQEIIRRAGIRLIEKPGTRIAEGRNIAIQAAKCPIIAVSDAGVTLDTRWLEHLVEPFERDGRVDVVAGNYETVGTTPFQRAIAAMFADTRPPVDSPAFLPSSRSIAFKKSAWKKVGGYPEWMTYMGEDTLFDLELKKAGYKFVHAPRAIVYWGPQDNFRSLLRQYFRYGFGDAEIGWLREVFLVKILIFTGITTSLVGTLWTPWLWAAGFGVFVAIIISPFVGTKVRHLETKAKLRVPVAKFATFWGQLGGYAWGLLFGRRKS